MELAFHEDEKSNTLKVRSRQVLSAEIIKEPREDHAEADKKITIASVILSRYANCQVIYSLSERERVAVNMQGIMFTFARLEIVPSYH